MQTLPSSKQNTEADITQIMNVFTFNKVFKEKKKRLNLACAFIYKKGN